jgi:hypothetical protein
MSYEILETFSLAASFPVCAAFSFEVVVVRVVHKNGNTPLLP